MSHVCFDCQKEFPTQEALSQHRALAHKHSGSETKKKALWPWLLGIVVIIVAIWSYSYLGANKYDAFAQCISASGAKFYGAFWCPHCAEQKAMFGSSARYLPYVECSTSDGKSQLPICTNAGIEGYPTWVFADGTRGNVMTLEQLSQKTACALP